MKARIITGFVLFCFAIYTIWFTSNYFFIGVNTVIMLLALFEWMALIPIKSIAIRILYSFAFFILLMLLYFQAIPYIPWLSFNTLLACWAILVIYRYNTQLKTFGLQYKWIKAIVGLLTFSSVWLSVNLMRFTPFSSNWLFFSLVIIWSSDVGAFFSGKCWGRRKLSPQVSPKKTWEGLFGGIVLALLLSIVTLYLFPMPLKSIFVSRLFGLIIFVSIFSVVGDLFESVMKRRINVKDSGSLLPGHGGILDRLDSLLFSLPLYALISLYLI